MAQVSLQLFSGFTSCCKFRGFVQLTGKHNEGIKDFGIDH